MLTGTDPRMQPARRAGRPRLAWLCARTASLSAVVGMLVYSLWASSALAQSASDTSKSSRLAIAQASKAELDTIKVGDTIRFEMRVGVIDGKVTAIDDEQFTVQTRFAIVKAKRDEIVSFERVRSNQDIYDERAAKCKTAADWLALAEWAEGVEAALAKKAYQEAIKVDPDNAKAHEALGEVKHDGKWMPLAEAMAAQGKEFYKGEWRTKEEIEALKKKEQDADRARVMEGRDAQRLEYEGRPWGESDPIQTPHYLIHCNSTEENAQRYADIMESLYTQYDRVFKKEFFPRGGKARNDVYIHANHRQFRDWTGSPPGVGGFFRPHPSLQDVTAYHGSFGTSGSTEEVLAHEGTHQFQSMIFKNMMSVPTWTIEGMACYFGDGSEITRHGVKINVIPRDRLLGLQVAIEDGSYCPLRQLIRLPHRQFSGFHYGHGWGIFYWCFYGNKEGAWKGTLGHDILNDWLIYCRDIEDGDLAKHAAYFEKLLSEKTGESVDDWEAEYKKWILGLKTEPIGKLKGSSWSSEKLAFSVSKPSGWKSIRDSELKRNEVVAFSGTSKRDKARRISTIVTGNWSHGKISDTLLNNIVNASFTPDREYLEETTEKQVYGEKAVVVAFKGRRAQEKIGIGGDATEGPENPIRTYRIVAYSTFDRIYIHVLECENDKYDRDNPLFEKYLQSFEIKY